MDYVEVRDGFVGAGGIAVWDHLPHHGRVRPETTRHLDSKS
ncbi:hypothetical protein P9D43_28425 [Neobacillus niacini]|nr:hypothetical protein [Neobacillus niacini]MEC1525929.1 hypothetical protein [Neobacillus niacini]